ncbi:MAG: addiction module protein [Rhodocyclales bacterium]|nr:addiction module protein [Rhodocyclales bacterium]
MTATGIAELPVAERLKLMETIWDSLCASDSEIESPAWHGEVLAERLRSLDSGADTVSDWKEARERVRNQAKAG